MNSPIRYITVAVAGPMRQTFTYHLPASLGSLESGQRLLVPFGRTRKIGYFIGDSDKPTGFETKAIVKLLDDRSLFPPDLFGLIMWMADYYFANPADCLAAALPSIFKTHKGATYFWTEESVDTVPQEVSSMYAPGKRLSAAAARRLRNLPGGLWRRLLRDGFVREEYDTKETAGAKKTIGYRVTDRTRWDEVFDRRQWQPEPFTGIRTVAQMREAGWTDHYLRLAADEQIIEAVRGAVTEGILEFIDARQDVAHLSLNDEQQTAFETVRQSLGGSFRPFLLHGVTGSGKTLVYCHLAREVLRQGKTVLVLTPEISLSGLTLAYFRGFFGNQVTIMHSAMTERERLESWKGVRDGTYRIVVGPRSAIFAPLENPGLIVVDEEHDGSYKQDDPAPRFHGRDAAVMRAKINDIPIVLGSASPSIESYHNAVNGRYELLKLERRPLTATLPVVQVVDMRREQIRGDMHYLSFPLKKKIDERLAAEEQVILFLNRRGYSPQLKCAECGHVPACPQCEVNLTYHKTGRKLSCHYCGYLRFDYDVCEACEGVNFLYVGAGTQKVEEQIPALFEQAKTVRFDSDTASGRKSAHRILREFAEEKFNLLLGTQMVTKGLDLSGVSLVGVLSADQGLDLPDFRASEKTFARLLQVAGRSGRAERRGEVVIQTYYPESEIIDAAARQDYGSFYETEITLRGAGLFPPFTRIIMFTFSGGNESLVERVSDEFKQELTRRATAAKIGTTILGPAPCPMYYLRQQFRRHLMLKTRQVTKLTRLLTEWERAQARFGLPSSVKVVVDVDPDDMM